VAGADVPSKIPLLRIGQVARPHGIRGAIRVALDNPESTSLETIKQLFIESGTGPRGYALKSATRLGRNAVRLELEGLDSCDAADNLRGATVMVATADLPPASTGEFYNFHAIGCEVRTLEGRCLGIVAEIFATGANDVLVVREGSAEVLVPLIDDVVKQMDFDRQVITIDAIPGLLD
jgi:16S rRNA processing protein RimM